MQAVSSFCRMTKSGSPLRLKFFPAKAPRQVRPAGASVTSTISVPSLENSGDCMIARHK
jgi:hypothetical protein